MHRFVHPLVLLLPLSGALLWPGSPTLAQSGTLQLPEHRQTETPPRAPSPAPLTPVHEDRHHTPVLQPRHTETRHKPPLHQPPPHPVSGHSAVAHPAAGHPAPDHAATGHAAAGHPAPRNAGAGHAAGAKTAVTPPAAKAETKPAPAQAAATPLPGKKQAPVPEPDKGATTGLPLPRFAALRTDEVNLRSGPGTRYPIEWVYKRRYLPVEIEREFDNWRLVRMPDGTRGWVHQATLTGRRSFDVERQDATLRAEPREAARAVAVLKPGVVGRISSCPPGSEWCRVQVGNYGGYLRRGEIWGVRPGEAIPP